LIKTFAVVLLVGVGSSAVFGQAAKAASSDPAEMVKQLERDWIAAQKAVNVDRLSQIVADDWAGLGTDGVTSTKKQFLDNVKSGASKVDSIEVGAMEVKVMGNVAVVQGSDTEKSSFKGKDTSGKWVWMDVFENRNGKWQAVRSQSALVK